MEFMDWTWTVLLNITEHIMGLYCNFTEDADITDFVIGIKDVHYGS